jgi:hypothetical protein
MRKIPEKQRATMAQDAFYKRCCYPWSHNCGGKIEFHHNLIFGGRQSNIMETILPVCQNIHDQARNTEVKEKMDLIMLRRMTPAQILSISKAINYKLRLQYLENKYS